MAGGGFPALAKAAKRAQNGRLRTSVRWRRGRESPRFAQHGLWNLGYVAQSVRSQHQVGVEGHGGAAVTQPRGHRVDVQAALQSVAGAAMAQAVGGRALDAGSGSGRLQSRFRNPLGNPAGCALWG